MKREYDKPLMIEVELNFEDVLVASFSKNEVLEWGGQVNEVF